MKVKAVDLKYCKNGLVQFMPLECKTNFIASPDEILFLKVGDKVIFNKYENHPYRYLFPYGENIKTGIAYNQLFQYRIPYINFGSDFNISNFSVMKFYKGNNNAWVCYNEISEGCEEEVIEELSREQIEAKFNKDNYDSMYIFSLNGFFKYAYNKKDGLILERGNIIPSDEEIISLDIEDRKYKDGTDKILDGFLDEEKKAIDEKVFVPRTIDAIKDLSIYNLFYPYLLLTTKDGMFNLKVFSIIFVKKDRFRLITKNIPIKVPTNIGLMGYLMDNPVEYTQEPVIPKEKTEKGKIRCFIPKWLRDLRK